VERSAALADARDSSSSRIKEQSRVADNALKSFEKSTALQIQARDRFAHRMAEEVRRAVVNMPVQYHKPLELLQTHIDDLLGCDNAVLTIKLVRNLKIRSVARVGDYAGSREELETESDLRCSHIYTLFNELEETQQQVMVPDTQGLPASEKDYKKRAANYGFASVLAFPIRTPDSEAKAYTDNSLLGFLSIDVSSPGGFDSCFEAESASEASSAQNFKPKTPLDLFYSVADSIASIVLPEDRSN